MFGGVACDYGRRSQGSEVCDKREILENAGKGGTEISEHGCSLDNNRSLNQTKMKPSALSWRLGNVPRVRHWHRVEVVKE